MGLTFHDRFFSSGRTEILNDEGNPAGEVDLKSAFGSSVDVYGADGQLVCTGKFRGIGSKWMVLSPEGDELGTLKYRFAFFTKKFEYDARRRGVFDIVSPMGSRDYEISEEGRGQVASFRKVSGVFASAAAFRLENDCERLSEYELVAVIMGMNAIQKRHSSAAAST